MRRAAAASSALAALAEPAKLRILVGYDPDSAKELEYAPCAIFIPATNNVDDSNAVNFAALCELRIRNPLGEPEAVEDGLPLYVHRAPALLTTWAETLTAAIRTRFAEADISLGIQTAYDFTTLAAARITIARLTLTFTVTATLGNAPYTL